MKLYLLFGLTLVCLNLSAQSTATYYEGTEGLSLFPLKQKLHEIVSHATISWNYSSLPLFYEQTDKDLFYENDGSILDIYSENPMGPDPYNYYYEDGSLISGAGEEGLGWNREHIVSQSFFNSNYPMYSDLHFVIPTDARVNQRRSNLPFGKVGTSPAFISLNGSKVGLSITPGYTLSVFEPIDEFKGDIARMIFYASVRYESMLPYFTTDNTRCPFEGRQEIAIKGWLLDQLIIWHNEDPVSIKEIERNNKIYDIQGNRNPFVDHPEWVESIWQVYSDETAPNAPAYLEVINKGKSFVEIKWDETGEIDVIGYEVYINDSLAGIVKNPQFSFHSLSPVTNYSFKVKTYDGNYNQSPFSEILTISTTNEDTFSNQLYISKIIEGSGNNKAIEITNTVGYTVDLRDYTITKREKNISSGTFYWNTNAYQMNGYLAHGSKIVLVHPEWNLECLDVIEADFVTAAPALLWDGKMAIRLNFKDAGIDQIGFSGTDTAFAENTTLYRNEDIKNPSISFNTSHWTVYPINYCENLGNNHLDTPSSIHPSSAIFEFSIYPNPVQSNSLLYVKIPNGNKVNKAFITDINGRIVLEKSKPFEHHNYLKIPEISKGIYILNMDGNIAAFQIR